MTINKYPEHIQSLVNVLPRGVNNAKPASYIAKLLGIDKRTVQAYKASAIRDFGIPIGGRRDASADNSGLFIIENEEERTSVLKVSSSQIVNEVVIQNALTQIDLDNWEDKQ